GGDAREPALVVALELNAFGFGFLQIALDSRRVERRVKVGKIPFRQHADIGAPARSGRRFHRALERGAGSGGHEELSGRAGVALPQTYRVRGARDQPRRDTMTFKFVSQCCKSDSRSPCYRIMMPVGVTGMVGAGSTLNSPSAFMTAW